MTVDGDKVTLHFDHAGGGLKAWDGKPLSQFKIAGADKQFVAAKATVEDAVAKVEAYTGDDPAERARLELDRDEKLRALQAASTGLTRAKWQLRWLALVRPDKVSRGWVLV